MGGDEIRLRREPNEPETGYSFTQFPGVTAMKPLIPLLIVAAALLSACETVQGAGRDLQSAGHAVSSGAQQVQNDL